MAGTLEFSKMHGLGNDFMVIDATSKSINLTPELIRQWGHRHFGVGFDQLLLVDTTDNPEADFNYKIFNPDGSEAEQCGNGVRCIVKFLQRRGLTQKSQLALECLAGIMQVQLERADENQLTVNMGEPGQLSVYHSIQINDREQEISVVSLGNPHAVLIIDDVALAPVASLGPIIEHHDYFPNGVNVEFMQIVNRTHIKLRVHERGTGETLACGSGACAAMAAAHMRGLVDQSVQVDLPGGCLMINWQGPGKPIWMTGGAVHVYDGVLNI